MSYNSGNNPERLTRNRFQTKIKEIKNKLNEADYSEYHLQNAEKRINLYSSKY